METDKEKNRLASIALNERWIVQTQEKIEEAEERIVKLHEDIEGYRAHIKKMEE